MKYKIHQQRTISSIIIIIIFKICWLITKINCTIESTDDNCTISNEHQFRLEIIDEKCKQTINRIKIEQSDFESFHSFNTIFPNLNTLIINDTKNVNLENVSIFFNIKEIGKLENIELIQLNIKNFPYFLTHYNLNKLKNLTIINNQLSQIPRLTFLSNLEQFDLHSNRIKLWQSHPELIELKILNLSSNKLEIIQSFLFANNHKLKELYLNDNQLIFIDLTIKQLSLNVLNLSGNQLKSISFGELKQIDNLIVSNNKIAYLNITENIINLNAESNHITQIYHYNNNKQQHQIGGDEDENSHFILKTLNLRDNFIETFDNLQLFHQLSELDLTGNRFHLNPIDFQRNHQFLFNYFPKLNNLKLTIINNKKNNLWSKDILANITQEFSNKNCSIKIYVIDGDGDGGSSGGDGTKERDCSNNISHNNGDDKQIEKLLTNLILDNNTKLHLHFIILRNLLITLICIISLIGFILLIIKCGLFHKCAGQFNDRLRSSQFRRNNININNNTSFEHDILTDEI